MNRFKVIIFDLGNVLIGFNHRIAVKKIVKFTQKPIEEMYNLFFDSDLTKAFEKGEISAAQFFLEVKNKLGIETLNFEEFVSIWNSIFWEKKGVTKLIKELKDKYKILILSNVNELHFNHIINNFKVISQVDKIIPSFRTGMIKPDSGIYKLAVKEASVPIEKIVYVEDRIELVEAARKLGMTAVHFKRADQLRKELNKLEVI